MDRGEQAAGRLIEREPRVLPGRALAESRQPLHVAPHRPRVRLERVRQAVRLERLLPRQVESRRRSLENLLARRAEFLAGGPQDPRAIVVEADGIWKPRVEEEASGIRSPSLEREEAAAAAMNGVGKGKGKQKVVEIIELD